MIKVYPDQAAYKQAIAKALGENFIGNGKLKKSNQSVKQFSIKIRNTTELDLTLVLFCGFLRTLRAVPVVSDGATPPVFTWIAIGGGELVTTGLEPKLRYDDPSALVAMGFPADAVADDGICYALSTNSAKQLTVTSTGMPFAQLVDFVKNNPCAIESIVINTNDKAFFETSKLTLKSADPFAKTGEEILQLGDFLSENQQISTKITVRPEKRNMILTLDDQSIVAINIPGTLNNNTTIDVNIQFNVAIIDNGARDFFESIGE